MSNHINIKGIRDGLLVAINGQPPYEEINQALTSEVTNKRDFLRGSRVVLDVGGRLLTLPQLTQWQEMFAQNGMALWAVLSEREATREVTRDLGLATRLPGSNMDLQGNGRPDPATPPSTSKSGEKSGYTPGNALVLKETLRSGRAVYHEGHIVIIGDVNPGAEIVAHGDIIVWGKLRGLVHAGAMGERSAAVYALDLSPTQLRIADQIAITPKSNRHQPTPEMAMIRDNQIVAEAWK